MPCCMLRGYVSFVNRADGELYFRLDGVLPSKEKLEAAEDTYRPWLRVRGLQEEVARLALEVAAPEQLVGMFGKPVGVEITYYGQLIDAHNSEIVLDGLKGICYPDDRARFVKRVELVDGGTLAGEEGPHLWVRVGPGLT